MRELEQRYGKFLGVVLLLALLLALPAPVSAQSGGVTIPENARAKGYGSGWECDRGYRVVGKECLAAQIPENAFSTNSTFGNGWECSWGYQLNKKACEAIKVPANAYLNSFGDKWKCHRCYRLVAEQCVVVELPESAHLDFSGNDWECNRPFRKQRDKCAPPG
jgi:hypothetical protein